MNAPFKIQTFEEFEASVNSVINPPKKISSNFKAVRWNELPQYKGTYEWLVKGLIAEREFSIVAGPSQSGKSFFVTDLAMCIARNLRFWGLKVKYGAVVYVAAESGHGVVSRRLPAYAQHHGLNMQEDIPFVTLLKSPNFYQDEEGVKKLIQDIKAYEQDIGIKVRLVVVDTFSAASAGADEVKSQSVSIVRQRFQSVIDECQCSVTVVHHMNGTGERVRGHSSLTADADSVLLVNWDIKPSQDKRSAGERRRDADNREIRVVSTMKVKEGDTNVKIKFVLKKVFLGKDSDNEDDISCVVIPPNGAEDTTAQSDNTPRMGAKLATYLRALKSALDAKGRPAPKDDKVPTTSICVKISDWQGEIAALIAEENEDPDKLNERVRKTYDRAMFALIDKGYIKKYGDWVWRTGKKARGIDPYDDDTQPKQQDEPHPEAKDLDPIGW